MSSRPAQRELEEHQWCWFPGNPELATGLPKYTTPLMGKPDSSDRHAVVLASTKQGWALLNRRILRDES